MYITIDAEDRRPIYQQIVDEVKALIAHGELPEGSSLPPVRQVAADLGVNLNTVAFAYRQLQREGLIRVRHGSGTVVISRLLDDRAEDQILAQFRAALTQLTLAGFTRTEITALAASELSALSTERTRKP